MNRRPGVTLIEVLVAIFVMGIGMLALLTLFPLGALSMAQSIRDDRVSAAAAQAAAIAQAMNVRNDSNVVTAFTTAPTGFNAADPDGPGYPVYVDPYYANLSVGNLGASTGVTPGLARCNVSFTSALGTAITKPTGPTSQAALTDRWFSLLDDLYLGTDGTATATAGQIYRPNTYTWAYLLRRPRSNAATDVELTVVVYRQRATQIAGDGESVYTVGVVGGSVAPPNPTAPSQGDAGVDILWASSGTRPNVKRNTWILDVTYEAGTTSTGTASGFVHGQFYRIVNVTDSLNPPSGYQALTLELDPPLKHANVKTVVVTENVAEVFYKGTGWQP
jgi:prepilin-type N-terminal cleavage/methylation domain-containing protein